VWHAWSGKFNASGTVIRLNGTVHRDSSYGYNRYMTAGGGFGRELDDTKLTSIKPLSDVPLFMDAVFVDFEPLNGSEAMPVEPPPDLRGGDLRAAGNEHWRFLIARHGRGINVGMADGSVRWTPLEEMYTLQWKSNWIKYRLSLPSY
jgi:prepilin-type processing-associated H-X9-DG protein